MYCKKENFTIENQALPKSLNFLNYLIPNYF